MAQEEIEIVLGPDGEVELVTHGVKGKRCMDYLAAFEKAVGKATRVAQTAEYFETGVETSVAGHVRRDGRRK